MSGWVECIYIAYIANLTDDQKVVGLNLVISKILDGKGAQAMPASITAPNSGSIMKKSTGC